MASHLIKDTTRLEREQIVTNALGGADVSCDDASIGLVQMYEEYIEGRKELSQINAEFRARYVSGSQRAQRGGCTGSSSVRS